MRMVSSAVMKKIVFTVGILGLGVVGKVKAEKREITLRDGTEHIHPSTPIIKIAHDLPLIEGETKVGKEQFSVSKNTINGVLYVNCISMSNDKVNALILDGAGNIVAWFTSKNMRVKNKQISLDLNFLETGNYSIRLKAQGVDSIHRFFKK